MDTESGRFVGEAEATPKMPRIEVGEVVELAGKDGAPLKVMRIDERTVLLELMSEQDRRVTALEVLGTEEFKRIENAGLDPWIPTNRHQRRKAEAEARKEKR